MNLEEFAKEHGFDSCSNEARRRGLDCELGLKEEPDFNGVGCSRIEGFLFVNHFYVVRVYVKTKDPIKALRRLWRAMTPKQRRDCGLLPKTVEQIKAKAKSKKPSRDQELLDFVSKSKCWYLKAHGPGGVTIQDSIGAGWCAMESVQTDPRFAPRGWYGPTPEIARDRLFELIAKDLKS